jgi:NADPH2:quinone reductase
MKKVVGESLENLAGYSLVEAPLPEPGPGQVRLRVTDCGLGYVDALVALGRYQVKPPLPHTPGQEVAGVVDALGEGVEGLRPGDRVMATVAGGFADFALAAAGACTPLPDKMTSGQAAGFRINHLTALHGLEHRAALRRGETLLVLGAAGGVGTAAVQVGKILGARVLACASTPEKRDFARARGPDVIFDPVCGPLFEPAFRSLAWGGRHLVVGFAGGPIPALPANLPLMKGAALTGVDVRQFLLFEAPRAAETLSRLLAWVEDGRLLPPEGRRFPLAAYGEALEFALSGQGMGKTLVGAGA